jgi:hypothetical protein
MVKMATICKGRSPKMEWIQEDTERDYSQTEYGKNTLVVGDRGDAENPQATLIQGDDGVDLSFERINGDHLQGMMILIQEDTERDYSQTEYGKNTLVSCGLRPRRWEERSSGWRRR